MTQGIANRFAVVSESLEHIIDIADENMCLFGKSKEGIMEVISEEYSKKKNTICSKLSIQYSIDYNSLTTLRHFWRVRSLQVAAELSKERFREDKGNLQTRIFMTCLK